MALFSTNATKRPCAGVDLAGERSPASLGLMTDQSQTDAVATTKLSVIAKSA